MSNTRQIDRRDITDPTTIKEIEDAFQRLRKNANRNSLIVENLPPSMFNRVKLRTTKLGTTMADVILLNERCANANYIGLFPPDHETYSTFPEVCSPAISGYYCPQFIPGSVHPAEDFGEPRPSEIGDVDPDRKYVISTRIRLCRTVTGVRFSPFLSKEARIDLESRLQRALDVFYTDRELKGAYSHLVDMPPDMQAQLIAEHLLYKPDSELLRVTGANNDWPTGRGYFSNDAKSLIAWIGEEDHLRLVSIQHDGNVGETFGRLIKAIHALSTRIEFARDQNYGFVTFCPTNLGSTIRASVLMKIPRVLASKRANQVVKDLKLQLRGLHGEGTDHGADGTCDISNKQRLGITEFEAVKIMHDGVKKLIKLEKELECGNNS